MEIDTPIVDFSSKENHINSNRKVSRSNSSRKSTSSRSRKSKSLLPVVSKKTNQPEMIVITKEENNKTSTTKQEKKNKPKESKDKSRKPLLLTLLDTLIEKSNEQDVKLMEDEDHIFNLPNNLVGSICSECAQIADKDNLSQIPKEEIINLLNLLQKQINVGKNMFFTNDNIQTILCCLDASLASLLIMSTKSAPKYVLIEEIIESVVSVVKYQMHENIFPQFDTTASCDGVKPKEKDLKKIFHKIGEIIEKCSLLVTRVKVTDSVVLNLTSIGLPVFFTEGVDILHLRSIELLRSIFSEYSSHRNAILQEIFHSLLKLPTSKRNIRKYKLIEQGNSIQMISALFLQLIQSCVTSFNESSYNESLNICKIIISMFMQQCTSHSSHQSEYKHILENLISDLLSVLFLPSWPAAEMMISILSGMLIQILNSASVSSMKKGGMPELNTKKSKELDQSRLMALKWLGMIASKMAEEIYKSKQFKVFEDRKRNENAMPSDEDEDASCICNQGFQEKFMLDCDRCNVWFHGECVGISPSDVPDIWYCDTCRILLQSQEKLKYTISTTKTPKTKKKAKKQKNQPKNDNLLHEKSTRDIISLQLIINYLMNTDNTNSIFARRFFITTFKKFYPEIENEICDDLWYQVPRRGISELSLSYNGTIHLIRNLYNEYNFLIRFKNVLSSILSVCNDKQMSFRATAVKSIACIIDSNPSLLGEPEICQVVNERKLDISVSVRQAIIDLVGNYILFQPNFISQYYEMIVDRIADTGISVRKRVIKILQNICLKDPNSEIVIHICSKLASRINDEESIRTIVLRTFQDLWFNNSSKKSQTSSISIKLKQIYAVTSSTNSHQWFVDLIKSLLENDKAKNPKVRNIVNKMCNQIIESMIELEEKTNDLNEITTKLTEFLTVLNLFCKSDPELLKSHVLTLQPYLQYSESQQSSKIDTSTLFCQVIEILELIMPLMKNTITSEFLLDLEEDLSNLIHSHSSMKVVQSATRCLCVIISNMTNHSIFIEEMLLSFREKLLDNEFSKDQPAICMRYLFTSGLLCRYYDFDLYYKKTKNTWKQSSTLPSDDIFSILLKYIESNLSPSISIKALQGLGHLLVRFPSLMVNCNDLFKKMLKTQNNVCTLTLLRNFGDFLLQEQQSLEGHSENVQTIRDQSDSGARVIQSNIDEILPLLVHSQANYRVESIKVIGQLIKHGLAHPVKVVSYLMALLADRTPIVSEQAIHWLQFIHQKNSSLLLSRLSDGIKLSFTFQQNVFQHANALVVSKSSQGPESLLSSLYRLYRSKRTTRDQFLITIIQLMQINEKNPTNSITGSFLKYLADLLVFLPFDIVGEPLGIIYQLDKIISLRTGAILKDFKNLLFPKKSSSKDLSLNDLKFHTMSACLPIILIKTKAFLKWGYSISARFVF